jgi:hypothetical protein
MTYILIVILSSVNPSIAMQEFLSRKACDTAMLYLEKRIQDLNIGKDAYLACMPKGETE